MVALDKVVKCWKLLVLMRLTVLLQGAVSLCSLWIPEGVAAVFMTDNPVVHHLLVVADRECVRIVHRSALSDEKVTLFNVEFHENLFHRHLGNWTVTQ